MRFAFQKIRLEAGSLLSIISTWAEMQLQVTQDAAVITGYGFAPDIAEAFTTLTLDWEASVLLPKDGLGLEEGTYSLILIGEELYACRDQEKFLLADREVVVVVNSMSKK